MAYNGSFKAPKIQPVPGGLFSVADVTVHADSDLRWATEEYTQEHNGAWTTSVFRDGTTEALDWSVGPEKGIKVWPFEILVEAEFHGINEINQNTIDEVAAYIEHVTEAAVEHELMFGKARSGATAQVLDAITAKQIAGGSRATLPAVSPVAGLSALEMPYGVDGKYTPAPRVIHLPADVATHLGSRLRPADDEGRIYTRLGTPVVVGSGYVDGDHATSQTYNPASRWGYTTGAVSVHLSEVYDLEDALRTGFNYQTNRLSIRLARTAGVSYDPTPETAVKFDLT